MLSCIIHFDVIGIRGDPQTTRDRDDGDRQSPDEAEDSLAKQGCQEGEEQADATHRDSGRGELQ